MLENDGCLSTLHARDIHLHTAMPSVLLQQCKRQQWREKYLAEDMLVETCGVVLKACVPVVPDELALKFDGDA
ncbi:hypothetical protein V6N13_070071 [Hibiscus sabdariffa]|uniref:Uncharacterized protein n=1 Tax=Hibiscus sabdariffa TaxID=183260 RepID=A0ABR2BJE5_9ROSI